MCYRRKSFWSISIGNGNINVVVCTYLYALRVARSVKSVGLILLATVSVCSMLYASIHAVVQLWFCACELRKISAWMTGTKDCISVKLANHYCGFSFVVVAAFLSKITAANKKTRTLSSTQFNFPDYIFFFAIFASFRFVVVGIVRVRVEQLARLRTICTMTSMICRQSARIWKKIKYESTFHNIQRINASTHDNRACGRWCGWLPPVQIPTNLFIIDYDRKDQQRVREIERKSDTREKNCYSNKFDADMQCFFKWWLSIFTA